MKATKESQVSRKYGDTEYKKSWIVISQELLKELNWKTGQELEGETKDNNLVIKKKKN